MPVLLPLQKHPGYYIWKYVPSIPAAVIFAILWLGIATLLSWRVHKTKTYFSIPFVIGCFMEFIGYCSRASAANKTDHLMPYVIQGVFILLPPALFAATIYMSLHRIIRLVHGDHLSIIRPDTLTKVFVSGDVLSFLIQGGSSGLTVLASTQPNLGKIGNAMVITGLAIQLISFAIFTLTALLFHRRLRMTPTERSYQVDQKWVTSMYMLYSISILIIIRSIFRIAEYVMGQNGYLLEHEWTLYVFDTILMFSCSVIFYYFYPSNLVAKSGDPMLLESHVLAERVIPKK
ncbi:hypothetical protein B7463_g5647, partial [Scytalidium lignicola]